MNYAVRWQPTAETQLLALYIRAADKDALAATTARIDEILARDPTGQGEDREDEAERLWFYRPLCLTFITAETERVVTVTAVKWVGR